MYEEGQLYVLDFSFLGARYNFEVALSFDAY